MKKGPGEMITRGLFFSGSLAENQPGSALPYGICRVNHVEMAFIPSRSRF